jgi:hypothetical protein
MLSPVIGRLRLDGIGDGEGARGTAVDRHPCHRSARFGKNVRGAVDGTGRDAELGQERGCADDDPSAVDRSGDSPARDCLEVSAGSEAELVAVRAGDDGGAQRVFASPLERRGQIQQFERVDAVRGLDRDDLRPAGGQGAGLVEDHDRHAVSHLERLATPEEDSCLCSATGAGHDRGRRRQAHRARAGDDHDANEGGQGQGQARLRTERKPTDERGDRDDKDGRDEGFADPVGKALDRRLGTLGMLDEGDNPGECRIGADAGRPEDE